MFPMMRFLAPAGIGAAMLAMAGANMGGSGPAEGRELWEKTEEPLTEILEVRKVTDWGRSQAESTVYDHRVQELIDEAVRILSVSNAETEREELRRIQDHVNAINKEIDDFRFKMTSAPSASELDFTKKLSTTTKEDYEQKIAARQSDIADLEKEAGEVKVRFAKNLEELGIQLNPEQVDGLLSLVTSDDLIEVMGVFENLKSISAVLLQATDRAEESMETAQRYYGVYAVMLELAVHMHKKFLERVDTQYMQRLAVIDKRTRDTRAEAVSMLGREKGGEFAGVLANNVKSLDLTLKASSIYRDHLSRQRNMVASSLSRVERQRDVAINTYRTVQVSADLVDMMRTTKQNFEALMKIDIPALRPFESIEMRREFDRLTIELSKDKIS